MKDIDVGLKSELFRQALFLTLAVWGLDTLLFALPYIATGKPPLPGVLASHFLFMSLGAVLSGLVYVRAARTARDDDRPVRFAVLVPSVVGLGLVMAACDLVIGGHMRAVLDGAHPAVRAIAARGVSQFMVGAWMFALLGALYLMMIAVRVTRERDQQLADARAQALAAEGQASAARLAALRYQLNPHFLFNTLNAVSASVITGRNEEAESMLARLAEFLRLTLAADPQAMITLDDELATLQAYLEIESVRFRDRLGLEFSCPAELRGALVPSFILQPLIENAVKHGVAPTSRPVTIRLEASRDGDDLVVIVEDDGEAAVQHVGGMGVGLTNVRQRLEVLYGPRGVLQAAPRERGFLVLIRIPLKLETLSRARAA
ncbi:histidine kinase [Caulobacter sp.]|uniref:sensor histidine kinase n=1 Tax=Caulobacter sp. TaxID=78 RepID=UPI001B1D47C3|nr:histidine kinase [Caulobacter sp.]MBO9545615.1 histidine kinase [Caulobacter sp.]